MPKVEEETLIVGGKDFPSEGAGPGDTPSRHRLSRYGPLALWLFLIFIASTGALSGSNTSAIFKPLLHWLFPHTSDATLGFIHYVVIRKGAHFTEYAVLGLLCARAFSTSAREFLRSHWFLISLALILAYSLSDEFHQSFVATRTPSIYDSMIDTSGGLVALIIYGLWQRKRRQRLTGTSHQSPEFDSDRDDPRELG